jgi:hypothetical protein
MTVCLEEQYTVPRIGAGISPDTIARRGFPGPDFVWTQIAKRDELDGARRQFQPQMHADTRGSTAAAPKSVGNSLDFKPWLAGVEQ